MLLGVHESLQAIALGESFYRSHPVLIGASGNDVGLPDGQMGNSEVGHLNLGAGRIVYQDIVRIDKAIDDGTFFANPVIAQTIDAVKSTGGTLHLLGLTSPGNVHAALEHAYAVCELSKRRGLTKIAWHAFLDGRDTPPKSAAGYLRGVAARLKQIGVGQLASAVGRYYAMDRDKRWDRLEVAWKMLTRGEGELVDDLAAAVEASYRGAGASGDDPSATRPPGRAESTKTAELGWRSSRQDPTRRFHTRRIESAAELSYRCAANRRYSLSSSRATPSQTRQRTTLTAAYCWGPNSRNAVPTNTSPAEAKSPANKHTRPLDIHRTPHAGSYSASLPEKRCCGVAAFLRFHRQ